MCAPIDVQIFLFMALFAVHLTADSSHYPPQGMILARVVHKSSHCCHKPPTAAQRKDDGNKLENVWLI